MEGIMGFIKQVDRSLQLLKIHSILSDFTFTTHVNFQVDPEGIDAARKELMTFMGPMEVNDAFFDEDEDEVATDNNRTMEHIMSHQDSSAHCPFCQKLFQESTELEHHMKCHHLSEPEPQASTEEEEDEATVQAFKVLSRKRRRVIHACPMCKKQFATKNLLNHHVESLHGDKVFPDLTLPDPNLSFLCCQKCYRCFKDQDDFSQHECPIEMVPFLEDEHQPAIPFPQMAFLEQHNRFFCGFCHEELRLCRRMRHHLESCRGGPLRCELCSEAFDSFPKIKDHKHIQHKNELAYFCHFCPKRFKLNTSLQKHLAKVHEKEKVSFKCHDCGKRFLKKVYLTNHRARFHNLFKQFLCQVCGDRFMSRDSLKAHGRTHESEKQFRCHICAREFVRKDKLTFHMATHTGERPHKCNLCDMAFIRKSKLKEHVRRHSGERRFSCLVCRKMYKGSHDLRKHLAKYHPNIGRKIKANLPLTPQILANFRPHPMKNAKDSPTKPKTKSKVNDDPPNADELIFRDDQTNELETELASVLGDLDTAALDFDPMDVSGPFFVGQAEQMINFSA